MNLLDCYLLLQINQRPAGLDDLWSRIEEIDGMLNPEWLTLVVLVAFLIGKLLSESMLLSQVGQMVNKSLF